MPPPQLRRPRKDGETKARGRRRVRRPEDPPGSSRRGRLETPGPTSRRYPIFRQQKSHGNVDSPDIRSCQCPDSLSMSRSPYKSVVGPYLILAEEAAWNLLVKA